MKRFYTSSILFSICCLLSYANLISPEQALDRLSTSSVKKARGINKKSLNLKRTINASGGQPAIYLFESDDECLLLSASDNVAPILGYIDNPINIAEIPDGLDYWMRYLADEVEKGEESGDEQIYHPIAGNVIAPLLPTEWGQTGAYNKYTPIVNDKQSPSGCVATALAQIMYYYKWPLNPVGSASCTDSNKVEYSMDFAGITFDWDKMTDTYNDDSSDESVDAVAMLMKCVGYGVDMNYGPSGSGAGTANSVTAMIDNFGYSNDLQCLKRQIFLRSEWEEMIYGMLAAGHPVYHTGFDGIWIGSGGHAFVCDGYDGDGYFHFNWGWEGRYNGYFLTSCLVPEGAGVGGYINGYNYKQEIFLNLYPDNGFDYQSVDYVDASKFDYSDVTKSFTAVAQRHPSVIDSYDIGMTLSDSKDNVVDEIILSQGKGEQTFHYQFDNSFTDNLEQDEEYILRLMWRNDAGDSWKRILPPVGGWLLNYPMEFGGVLKCVDGVWIFTPAVTDHDHFDITVDSLTFNDRDYLLLGEENKFSLSATNNLDDYFYHGVRMNFVDVETGEKPKFVNFSLEINPKSSTTLAFTLKAFSDVPEGKYYMELVDAETKELVACDRTKVFSVLDKSSLPTVDDGTFVYQIMSPEFALITGTVDNQLADGDIIIPEYAYHDGVAVKVGAVAKQWKDLISLPTIKSLDIQMALTEIGNNAFEGCIEMEELRLPSTLKAIGKYAFYKCNKLKQIILPEGLESLGLYSFGNCYVVTDIRIPGTLKDISNYAFSSCRELRSISLPEGVERIGTRAFTYSYELEEITLPSTLQSIEDRAFYSFYDKLKTINCYAVTPPTLASGAFNNGNYSNATLHIPSETADAYRADSVWSQFLNMVDDNENLSTSVSEINLSDTNDIRIYNLSGVQIANTTVRDWEIIKKILPPGLYIVVSDAGAEKIRL